MSIFKSTFKKYIRDQIEVRQNARSEKERALSKNIQYLNSKTAWIRLSSSVDVDPKSDLARRLRLNGNQLAKKYVLQGGTLLLKDKDFILRRGIGSGGGSYGDKILGGPNENWPLGGREELGIRPMPGINNVQVKSKSAYGSLREASINIQCWSMSQLEELELLYMRPGYTVLLEWGWSLYLDNKSNLVNTPPKFINILDNNNGNLNKQKLFETIAKQNENSAGNYDAMYGYVKNFTWTFREDGGFDCRVDIISIGEVLESLKLNYATIDEGVVQRNISKINDPAERDDISKIYKINKFKGTLLYIQKRLREETKGKTTYSIQFNEGKGKTITTEYLNLKFGFSDTPNNLGNNLTISQVYIPLRFLVDILNEFIVMYDVKNNTPYLQVSVDDDEGNPLTCFGFYRQVPLDPRVCLIVPSSPNLYAGDDSNEVAGPDFLNSLVSDKYKFFIDSKSNLGNIGNIFLNIGNLISIIDNISEGSEKGIVDLYTFLKTVMSQVQKSIGNINNFDIHINDNTARIIDLQFIENQGGQIRAKDTVQIEIFGLKTTARRGCSMNSSVFPSQATMIAISAQAGGGALGFNNSTYIKFNEGLVDRIIPIKDENISQINVQDNLEQKILEDKQNAEENFRNSQSLLVEYFKAMNNGRNILTDKIEVLENALRDNIYYEINSSDTQQDSKYKGIMPLKLTIPMDGIGGIVIGEIFTIPDSRLPLGYRSSGDFKVGFIVTGISHELQSNDWVTVLDTQTCILKP